MNDNLIPQNIPYHRTGLAKFDETAELVVSEDLSSVGELVDCTVVVSRRDVKVKLSSPLANHGKGGGKRQSIKSFSRSSQQRLLYKVRNMAHMTHLCTLTYHNDFPLSGKSCKNHWKLLKQRILYKYPEAFGIWFFEFQERGAPHFHFFTNAAIDNDWLRSAWQEVTGDPTIICVDVTRCTKEHGAASYASKIYSAKADQKNVPENFMDVGRFWGVFGDPDIKKHEENIELNKGETGVNLVSLVRLIRRATKAKRRSLGLRYKPRGGGVCGFTAYDCSQIVFQYLNIDCNALGSHFEFSLIPPD